MAKELPPDNILKALKASGGEADTVLIQEAYDFAKEAHKGHTRYSGEPYLNHLVSVATMLAEIGMGSRTVAAGLLHDTVEDTGTSLDTIKTTFGDEIAFLVEGITKLGSVRYYGSDRHNESLRKLFVATSQDIRVLIIKLVDRLHNMKTFEHVPKEKQLRIARETLEIYVPVAHRLGMGRIRKELEDLAFPYVYPDEYKHVMEVSHQMAKDAETELEKTRFMAPYAKAHEGLHRLPKTKRLPVPPHHRHYTKQDDYRGADSHRSNAP